MPKGQRRKVVTFTVAALVAVIGVYFLLSKIAGPNGFNETLERIRDGKPAWLALAVVFEVCSFVGYVVLFRTIFVDRVSHVDWRASYQITMAGVAATRLFAAAGAGGVALTFWALRQAGMSRRLVTARIVTFLVVLYGVYMFALLIDGLFLRIGLFPGGGPVELTLVPAAFAGTVIVVFGLMALIPGDLERRLQHIAGGSGWPSRWAGRLAAGPALVAKGTRTALRMTAEHHFGLLGALAWWTFDIAALWACFHAFGDAPPQAVLVMGYFVGMMANVLPFFPGGIGSVDLGMVGALAVFGVPGSAAVAAVLSYRVFAFWLPTLPGAFAYWQLRKTVRYWSNYDRPVVKAQATGDT